MLSVSIRSAGQVEQVRSLESTKLIAPARRRSDRSGSPKPLRSMRFASIRTRRIPDELEGPRSILHAFVGFPDRSLALRPSG